MEEASSQDDNAYTYDSLSDEQGYFRYLILKPGTGDDPLRCNIHTARIEDVSYEAISYVWGSEEKPEAILCDEQMMSITVNLHAALSRLRLPDKNRVLWADSICIDQDNLQEKGHQIAQMGSIYRDADHVLICLDADEDGHANRASALIKEVIKMIQMAAAIIDPSKWNTFPWPDHDDRLLSDARWDSVNVLLRQVWFERGWVVREAALAQAASMIWGSIEIPWRHLMETLEWVLYRGSSLYNSFEDFPLVHLTAYKAQHPQRVRKFLHKYSWDRGSLLDYLHYGRSLGLKDDRDRLFAFLGLASGSELVTIAPEYSAPPLEIYWSFALQYLEQTKNLDLLAYVLHDDRSWASGIPSWVPRWDIFTAIPIGEPWRSRKTSRTSEEFAPKMITRETLEVRGVCFDRIAVASDVLQYTTTTLSILVSILQSLGVSRSGCVYEDDRQLEAFFYTLTIGASRGDLHTWKEQEEECIAAFSSALEADAERRSSIERHDSIGNVGQTGFFHSVRKQSHGNRAIVTDCGYLGLAPAVAAVGDTCAIIFGSKSTCVLRSTDRAEHYRFLGYSYILGRHWRGLDWEFGSEYNKDWVDWDVEEQDIFLR